MEFLLELAAWARTLEPEFAFLLGLPFAIVAIAFIGAAWERRRTSQSSGAKRVEAPPARRPVGAP